MTTILTPSLHASTHLPLGSDSISNVDALLNGSSVARETFPRGQGLGNTVGASVGTGIMAHSAVVLYAGDVVTNITMLTGSAAAVSPTHWWFALYDNQATPALMAQTADQTSTALPANTYFTIALGAPQTISTTGVYYIAWMVTAGTVASWCWRGISNALTLGTGAQKRLQGSSGSGLLGVAPATIASPSVTAFQIWAMAT
jgi:hypothetical protein